MTLEEQVRRAVDAVSAQLRDDLSRRLQTASDELAATLETAHRSAIDAAVDAAVDETRARIERETVERLTEDFEAARTAAVAQAAVEATNAAEQTITARLTAAFADERDALVAEHDAVIAEREAEHAAARDTASAALAAHERTAAERDAAHAAQEKALREAHERAIADAQRETEALREAGSRAEQQGSERARIAEAELSARVAAETSEFDANERLVAAIRAIDSGASLSDILGALATGASGQAARAALLVADGGALRSWRASGFGAVDRDGVKISDADGGIVLAAMRSGVVVHADAGSPAPHFAGLADDRAAIAVPLVIANSVIGVLYADEGADEAAGRASWPMAIEILGRHAARALAALTAARLVQAAGSRPADTTRGSSAGAR